MQLTELGLRVGRLTRSDSIGDYTQLKEGAFGPPFSSDSILWN